MLYHLFNILTPYYSGFNAFSYLTTRALMAGMTALMIGWSFGPFVVRKLRALKMGQAIRDIGPQSHLQKAGTPTMGGVLILISVTLSTLLWADLSNRFVWIVLFVMLSLGVVGWIDDYRKVVYKDPKGMSSKEKFFWQTVIALVTSVYVVFAIAVQDNVNVWQFMSHDFWQLYFNPLDPKTQVMLPFFKHAGISLGAFGLVVLTWFVVVGSSNAVNLTDGLDGLAILPTVIVGGALGVFAYVVGRVDFSHYFLFPYIPGAGEVMILSMALFGAGLAFLWFNAYPAQVFMGDVGSLALGGMLGTMAVIVRQELVFFVMSGIFVAEVLSVMLQVTWYRYTKKKYGQGRRLLRMSPLHHHFEEKGWHETKVVVRFWIINILLVFIGLLTLKLR